jgi:hypothetical protein
VASVVTHPLTGQVYRLTDEGLVEVSDPESGLSGLFDSHGNWISGQIRHADLQLSGWVGRRARQSTPGADA